MYFAYGFSRMLLIVGFFVVLVSAMSLSASARNALRHNKIQRIRGGSGSFKDLAEMKKKSSESLMRFADVAVATPRQCNATKKIKLPFQYYF